MYDVAIVGGGPGGAAAAVALGQRGVKNVVLIDRDPFPRDKTCGSGLSPNALKLIKELGIDAEVRERAYPIMSVKIVTPGGRDMVLASNAAALVLLRRHFDNLLIEKAKSFGVEVRAPWRADGLITEDDRVIGVRGFDGSEIRAKYVLCADGANSIFSHDPRPKRSIATLMGWWDDFTFAPGQLEMIFDKDLAPLYGWLFPESNTRVNIGICVDGQDEDGQKTTRNLRETFERFLQKHYGEQLKTARQVGKLKGHPIVYSTWVGHVHSPGALFLGEAARITHNATGEGISQAMQSGVYAAEALSRVLVKGERESKAWAWYLNQHRKKFTSSFIAGHMLRGIVDSPFLDHVADMYNNPLVRKAVVKLLGSALAGSSVHEAVGEVRSSMKKSA